MLSFFYFIFICAALTLLCVRAEEVPEAALIRRHNSETKGRVLNSKDVYNESVVIKIGSSFAHHSQIFVMENQTVSSTVYSIAVVEKIIESFSYSYEFLPFNCSYSGCYDTILKQLRDGKYDIAIVDTTIQSDRAKDGNFAQNYTIPGVSMVVVQSMHRKPESFITFLKPFKFRLWVACVGFFIITAVIVWFLEREHNPQSSTYSVGNSVWCFMSTMFFTTGESVVSLMARVLVVFWFVIMLIMTQYYNASLASFLTVEKLESSRNRLKDTPIGYNYGSFVKYVMQNEYFKDQTLRSYITYEELIDMVRKGSIGAVFDETSNLKPIIENNCSGYTVSDVMNTGDLEFVFPKDWWLASNFSNAILELQNGVKHNISSQAKLLSPKNCVMNDLNNDFRLDIENFKGLFFMGGMVLWLGVLVGLKHYLTRISRIRETRKRYQSERPSLDFDPYMGHLNLQSKTQISIQFIDL